MSRIGRTPQTSSSADRARGFTLLEIIVVVLVFTVMSVMAYGGLRSVLRTRSGIESAMTRTADLQRAYLRLRTDFQNLRDRPARDEYGDAQASLSIDRDGRLRLIRGGQRNPLGASRSSLERVQYTFKDHALHRATFRAIDLPQKSEPVDLVLLANVEEVRWRFLDTAFEWQEEWPVDANSRAAGSSSAGDPPPLAVEITLVTKDWGETRFLFRTPQAGLVSGGGGDGSATEGSGPGARRPLITTQGLLPASAMGTGGAAPSPGGEKPDNDSETPTEQPQSPPPPEPETPADPGIPSSDGQT